MSEKQKQLLQYQKQRLEVEKIILFGRTRSVYYTSVYDDLIIAILLIDAQLHLINTKINV